jgi:hypothetical protein
VLAAGLRLVTVAILCGLVIREIWRPELDVVRSTYADDPDGGPFDGAADAGWIDRFRRSFGIDKRSAADPEPEAAASPT